MFQPPIVKKYIPSFFTYMFNQCTCRPVRRDLTDLAPFLDLVLRVSQKHLVLIEFFTMFVLVG